MKIHTFEVEVNGPTPLNDLAVGEVSLGGVVVFTGSVRWMHGPDAQEEAEAEILDLFARKLAAALRSSHDHGVPK